MNLEVSSCFTFFMSSRDQTEKGDGLKDYLQSVFFVPSEGVVPRPTLGSSRRSGAVVRTVLVLLLQG